MDNDAPIPEVVDGEVILQTSLRAAGIMVFWAFSFLFGLFLVYAKLNQNLQPGDQGISWYGFLLGVLFIVASPAGAVMTARQLIRRRRLLLGSACFQVVEREDGDDVVLAQIPYSNVAKVQYESRGFLKQVLIAFKDEEDPDTCVRAGMVNMMDRRRGWGFVVGGGYKGGVPCISKLLKERVRKFQRKQ